MENVIDLFAYKNNFALYKNVNSELRIGQKMTDKPFISVLMPIYNHFNYLEKAICSVLNQTTDYKYEVIIVDNNHPEYQKCNEEIVRKLNTEKVCYYVNERNIGPSGNWNRCIELAQGEYVTFCHDDDMLTPNALRDLAANIKMEAPKRYVIGSNNTIDSEDQIINSKRNFLDRFSYLYTKYLFLVNNPNNGCGSLYHRESIMNLGGYDSDYQPTFDYALNVKYSFLYGALKIPNITFNYRVTETSDSANCYKEIPKAFEQVSSSLLTKIHLFKAIAKRASKSAIKNGAQMSEIVWEGKKPTKHFYNRLFLSLYIRVVTLLSIR